CALASGDCCACELPLQTGPARNAVQLHLAMRARQEKLKSGWFVPEQQTERFAMTHPPRGGFYSSDVQLYGQNFCICPSDSPWERMFQPKKWDLRQIHTPARHRKRYPRQTRD